MSGVRVVMGVGVTGIGVIAVVVVVDDASDLGVDGGFSEIVLSSLVAVSLVGVSSSVSGVAMAAVLRGRCCAASMFDFDILFCWVRLVVVAQKDRKVVLVVGALQCCCRRVPFGHSDRQVLVLRYTTKQC